jgi:hypothetical protein
MEWSASCPFGPLHEFRGIADRFAIQGNDAISRLPTGSGSWRIRHDLSDIQMKLWFPSEADQCHHDDESQQQVHEGAGTEENGPLPAGFGLQAVRPQRVTVFANDADESAERNRVDGIEDTTAPDPEQTRRQTDPELEDTDAEQSCGEKVTKFVYEDEDSQDRNDREGLHGHSLSRVG